ncbi:MAG TPA: hypothetical protein VGD55_09100, partial [Acidothermaceae bacterium]
EYITAAATSKIVKEEGGVVTSVVQVDDQAQRNAINEIRDARRSGRRRVTPDLLVRVAAVHADHADRPVEAVQDAFQTAYRTAARYVQLARAQGLIPPKEH